MNLTMTMTKNASAELTPVGDAIALDGKGLRLGEFAFSFVNRQICSALREQFIHCKEKDKLIHTLLSHLDDEEDDADHVLRALCELSTILVSSQQSALLAFSLGKIRSITSEANLPEYITAVLKLMHDVLKSSPANDSVSTEKANEFLSFCFDRLTRQKWFITASDGVAVVQLIAAIGQLIAKTSHIKPELISRLLQEIADLLANEDLGEHRLALLGPLQELALERSAPVFLPPPTPPSGLVNEQFAAQ